MKAEVSPVIIGVVVVCLVAIGAAVLWRTTGGGGHKGMSPRLKEAFMSTGGGTRGPMGTGSYYGSPSGGR